MTTKKKKPAIHDQIVPAGFIEKMMAKSEQIAARMKVTKYGTAEHAKLARDNARTARQIFNALDKDSNYRGGQIHQIAKHAATTTKIYADTAEQIATHGLPRSPLEAASELSAAASPWQPDKEGNGWHRVFVAPNTTSHGQLAAHVWPSDTVKHWNVNWMTLDRAVYIDTALTCRDGMVIADAGLQRSGTRIDDVLPLTSDAKAN